MGAMVARITSLTIVYSTVYTGADQRKHQSSASLAFMREIHRWPMNSPHKWPVTGKMFPFNDVIMNCWELSTPPWCRRRTILKISLITFTITTIYAINGTIMFILYFYITNINSQQSKYIIMNKVNTLYIYISYGQYPGPVLHRTPFLPLPCITRFSPVAIHGIPPKYI